MVNKLNKKFYPLIWIASFLAGFIANIYYVYETCVGLVGVPRAQAAIDVFMMIIECGILPMVVTFFVAWIVYIFSFRRFIRFISRNDFCLFVMLTSAIASAITGFIGVFSFLVPEVSIFTTTLSGVVIEFTAMAVLFFAVFSKVYKPNPIEKSRAFTMWSIVFMVLLGLGVVGNNITTLIVNDPEMYELIVEMMIEMEMQEELKYLADLINPLQVGVSIATLVLFALEVIAVIVVHTKLRNDARSYQNPETREEYMQKHYQPFGYEVRDGVESTFEEFDNNDNQNVNNNNDNKDSNVFDEFDL